MKTDRRKFITTTASIIGGISLRKLRIEPELKQELHPGTLSGPDQSFNYKKSGFRFNPGSYIIVMKSGMESGRNRCDHMRYVGPALVPGASERVAEMAPFLNNVVSIARKKGS